MNKKLSARHKIMFGCAAACLLLGFMNYFLFQTDTEFFKLFHWKTNFIELIHNGFIKKFLTGYFSDIMWCSALYLTSEVLRERNTLHFINKILILLLPFAIETTQYFGWINGTFDWYDLLTYAIILLLFIIFFPGLNPLKNENK